MALCNVIFYCLACDHCRLFDDDIINRYGNITKRRKGAFCMLFNKLVNPFDTVCFYATAEKSKSMYRALGFDCKRIIDAYDQQRRIWDEQFELERKQKLEAQSAVH